MSKFDIIDQHVTVDVKTHEPDPRQRPPWNWSDMRSGRVNWNIFRNSRWSNLINQNAQD
jgi:hypothetical protein